MRFNETEYKLDLNFINSNSGPNASQEYTLFKQRFFNIRYNFNTNFTSNNTATEKDSFIQNFKLQAEYLHDDINVHLVYFGLTNNWEKQELNPNSRNIFSDENNDILAEDEKFYQDIKDITHLLLKQY